MREAGAEERDELRLDVFGADPELLEAGLHVEAEDAGVDLGRRREGAGRKGKEQLDGAVELHCGAQYSVIAAAG